MAVGEFVDFGDRGVAEGRTPLLPWVVATRREPRQDKEGGPGGSNQADLQRAAPGCIRIRTTATVRFSSASPPRLPVLMPVPQKVPKSESRNTSAATMVQIVRAAAANFSSSASSPQPSSDANALAKITAPMLTV